MERTPIHSVIHPGLMTKLTIRSAGDYERVRPKGRPTKPARPVTCRQGQAKIRLGDRDPPEHRNRGGGHQERAPLAKGNRQHIRPGPRANSLASPSALMAHPKHTPETPQNIAWAHGSDHPANGRPSTRAGIG